MKRARASARALVLLLAMTGCSREAPPSTTAAAPPPPGPLRVSDVLPLDDRTVSTFVSRADDGSETTFMLEIFRPSPTLAHLVIAGRTQRLVVRATSVEAATGGLLLAEPLARGTEFRGAFGTVTVTEVGVPVRVRAGLFERCVVTVEESRSPPKRAEAAYCEGVGLSRLVVEGGGQRVESELVSHGPRVEL